VYQEGREEVSACACGTRGRCADCDRRRCR
jgi:hypothetical protein